MFCETALEPWQGEFDRAPLAFLSFDPYLSAIECNDTLDYGEANAASRRTDGPQPDKRLEDTQPLFNGDSDAMVLYGNAHHVSTRCRGDPQGRRLSCSRIFQGV